MKSTWVRISCLMLILVSAMVAQEFRATISGEVTDPAGAAIEGAKVVVTSVERNVPYDGTTNSAGRYTIPFLLPGKYTVSIEKPGFKKFVREGVTLVGQDKIALDIRLELGAVVDSVTVTGDVSLLQTETATRQTAFENRIIETVPSGGRNIFALMYDQPGVVKNSTYWGSMELYAFGNVNGVSISGGRPSENETVLDGATNTKSDRGVGFVPSINATQEFTVQTNSYDAQFGRVGGGVTMINVKSGTNALHGQLFEFFKNDKFRAMDWVANKDGETKTPFKNNTFGFEVDGPFYIPKIFDGRNKAFFMISLEALREHNPGGTLTTIPLAEQLTGNFANLFNGSGQQVVIYDPASTRLGADGKTYVRTPFTGNVLPSSRINPIAAKVASFYPAPTFAGDSAAHLNNYAKILPSSNNYDSWLGKMDYMFNEKQRISFRYGQTPWLNFSKLSWGTNAAEPSGEYPSTRIPRTWGADWTYTVSPSVVANIRFGLSRYEGQGGNTLGVGYDPRQLGFPSSLVSQFSALMFPRFNLGGNYSPLGANPVFSYSTNDAYSLQPNVSWTRGRHFVKIGTEFRRYNDNSQGPGLASGSYTFSTGFTGANPNQSDSTSGNEFASFLLGNPSSGQVDRNIYPAYRNHYYAAYVQDDFKLSQKLTLNLGLRWDYETPRYERFDRMVIDFPTNIASPIAAAVKSSAAASNCPACAAGLTGGIIYAGQNSEGRYLFNPKKGQIQPRIGVAYRATNKMVFRGGFALSYLGQSASGQSYGYSRSTSLTSSLDGGLTPAVSLSDPYPASIYPTGLLTPVGNSQGTSTNLGQGISVPYRDRALPYSKQYSFGLQYELPGGWLADASYVGNITRRVAVNLGLNFIPMSTLTSVAADQRSAYFSAQLPNPMAGLLSGSGLNNATLSRAQLLYAFPQYNGVTMTDVPIGRQRYDALQLKLAKRFSHGFTTTISYTASKTIEAVSTLNAQDVNLSNLLATGLEKRVTQYDVPQQLSVIGSYDLPFGKGRPLLSNMNKYAQAVIGGWTFSGVFMTHSGFPLNFPNAGPLVARSAKFNDAQRDKLAQTKGRTQYDPSYDVWFDTSIFPTKSKGTYDVQTWPTRFPDVRTKPLNVADLSLYKEFNFWEKVRWQIRADAHNAANFPWFGALDGNGANVTNANFGHLRADIGNETRIVVFVMKVIF